MSWNREMHKGRMSEDPRVWWSTAAEDIKAASDIYQKYPLVALDCCHKAIEKALKGYMAARGPLPPEASDHRLTSLLEIAGLSEAFPKEWRIPLSKMSPLHEVSNYPYDEHEYRALNEKGYVTLIVTTAQKIFMWIKEKDREQRKSGKSEEGGSHGA